MTGISLNIIAIIYLSFILVVNSFRGPFSIINTVSKTVCIKKDFCLEMAGGFGKPKDNEKKDFFIVPTEETLCACSSGKTYHNCCKVYHDGKETVPSPSLLVRSRFSAFVYGIISYLMKTTHPAMKDFVPEQSDDDSKLLGKRSKRQIWEKDLKSFAEDFEFASLSFDNEESDNNIGSADVAAVSFKLERRLRGSLSFDQIEEKSKFKKGSSGEWLYVGSDMTVKSSASGLPPPPKRMVMGTNKKGVPKGN